MIDDLETHEDGEYVKVEDLKRKMRDKKLVSKSDFMNAIERLVGFCTFQERVHSYIDFVSSGKHFYNCTSCGQDIDAGRWESAQTLETFLFDQPWVELKNGGD